MGRRMTLFLACALALASLAGCAGKKVPDWAVGKWRCSALVFEITPDAIMMDSFRDTQIAWGKGTAFTAGGVDYSANTKITKSSDSEFAFTVNMKSAQGGASGSSSVSFLMTKDKDNAYSIKIGENEYGLRKR